MKKLILLAALVACDQPPPVSDGKCVIQHYTKKTADKQVCNYKGYVWMCTDETCTLTGEAVGERPAQ